MATEVKFQIGVPQRITLRNAQGREYPSKFEGKGPRYLHALLPDGITYLELPAERMLQELGVQDGETVEITKPGNRGFWNVRRLEASTSQTVAMPATNPGNYQNHQNAPNVHQPTAPAAVPPTPQQAPTSEQPTSVGGKLVAGALIAAIDAAAIAQRYAAQKGMPITFTGEDVKALASTLLIQYWKSGMPGGSAPADGGRVNGGTSWQH